MAAAIQAYTLQTQFNDSLSVLRGLYFYKVSLFLGVALEDVHKTGETLVTSLAIDGSLPAI